VTQSLNETLLEPRLLRDGTSLLTPGIIDMSNVQQVADEEVFGQQTRLQ
jgi:succinylglutamic semialdehyde dehydrogenase